MKPLAVLLAVLVALACAGCSGYTYSAPAQKAKPDDPCGDHAFDYLLALKEGNSIGFAFWKPGTKPARLFNVHDFDEITHGQFLHRDGKPYKVPRVYYQYDVQSSTQGGLQIRKRWDVVLEPSAKNAGGLPCAIVDLTEAE
jgi:hypothetical protein